MKLSKRSIIIISILAVFVLFLAGILLAANSNKFSKYTEVALYDLNARQQKSIAEQLVKITNEKGKVIPIRVINLDSTKPLSSQAKKKFDLIITTMGQNTNDTIKLISEKKSKAISLPQTILEGTTISVKQSVVKNSNGNLKAVPILLDNYEIDIDRTILNQCGIKTISTWQDIEKFALAAQKYAKSPIVFAGGDSDTFLGIIGALTEAFSGKQAYDKVVETIHKSIYENKDKDFVPTQQDYENIIKSLSENEDSPLFNALQVLIRWQRLGLLNSEIFNMKQNDVAAFMEAKLAPISFMTLSQHREVEHNIIERYSSIYFPSERTATSRYFTAPMIIAIPYSKSRNVATVITNLISSNGQEQIGRSTGLAPVLASCRVADHQADDVRYWIAATNAPIVPMGKAIFTDKKTEDDFAKALGSYIKYSNQ